MNPDEEMKKEIDRWGTMQGIIKKKRKSGSLMSKLDSSVTRYFKLWCDGRFFCYYDEKPVSLSLIAPALTVLGLQQASKGSNFHN
jgi:hypothetical protein